MPPPPPPAANESFWNGKTRVETGRRTRIFISHSSTPDEKGDEIRKSIADKLEARGFEVLLDERVLGAGDRWRSKIYRWLGMCEGAVVLLNQAVLDRAAWVRFEAEVLGWRYETGDLARLVPVFLPDFDETKLDELGLGPKSPVRIPETQCAKYLPGERRDRRTLVRRVVAAFDGLESVRDPVAAGTSSPMRAWIRLVRSQLRESDFLAEAAAELEIPAAELPADRDVLEELVAYRLLHSDLLHAENAILQLDLSQERRNRLAKLVVPSWVPPAAVRFLTMGRREKRGRRVTQMTAERDLTAMDFVSRATCCDRLQLLVPALSERVGAEDARLAMETWYRGAILDKLGADPDLGADAIERGERQLEQRGRSVFVILGRDALDSGVAPKLLDQFKGSCFVLNGADQDLERANMGTRVRHRCAADVDIEKQRDARQIARRLLPEGGPG